MKTRHFAAAIAALSAVSLPALAQTAPAAAPASPGAEAARIVIVDTDRILRDSIAAKAASDELNVKLQALRAETKRQEDAFKLEQDALGKMRGSIEEASFNQKVQEFQAKYGKIQQDLQKRDQDIQIGVRYARSQIAEVMNPIIQEEMQARGANVAMDVTATIATKTTLDITNAIMTKLNGKLQKVSITPPPPPSAAAATPAPAPAPAPAKPKKNN